MLYQICFYVPIDHAETVKNALFDIGVGKIGHYSHCSWQTLGEGQFLPLENSHPHLGKPHQLEKVPEYKIEMVCDESLLPMAIQTLHQAHPYETPAYHIIRLHELNVIPTL